MNGCPMCGYSAPPKRIKTERKHFAAHALECTRCLYRTETTGSFAAASRMWDERAAETGQTDVSIAIVKSGPKDLLRVAPWKQLPAKNDGVPIHVPAAHVFKMASAMRAKANEYHGALARRPKDSVAADWKRFAEYFDTLAAHLNGWATGTGQKEET